MNISLYLHSHPVLKGTIFLTLAGLISRVMGFFYKIFLSREIGAEGMGIYQLIFPVFGLLLSLCISGIQTSISKVVAASASNIEAKLAFRTGLTLSLFFSSLAAFLLYDQALPIADLFLSEERCAPLLRILAPALPLSCIHACINGYYYGMQKSAVPSITQLAEQAARMFFIWIAVKVFAQNGQTIPLSVTVWAIVAGEAFATLFSVTAFSLRKNNGNTAAYTKNHKKQTGISHGLSLLLPLAVPLTANRLLVSLLSCTESILIPARLQLYGHSAATALGIYGVLTGMAMPLVLFPTAITGSVSVLLLPSVAHAQAAKNLSQIRSAIQSTFKYCLILGIFFGGIFLVFGGDIGCILYENTMAGDFLMTLAWICPFLYLTATLSSILNGLGKTTAVFFQSITCVLVRILFVLFLIPQFGILAYLWGLLASLLVQTALELVLLRPYMDFPFPAFQWILTPVLFLILSIGCSYILRPALFLLSEYTAILALGIQLTVIGTLYILFLTLYSIISGNFFLFTIDKQKKKSYNSTVFII